MTLVMRLSVARHATTIVFPLCLSRLDPSKWKKKIDDEPVVPRTQTAKGKGKRKRAVMLTQSEEVEEEESDAIELESVEDSDYAESTTRQIKSKAPNKSKPPQKKTATKSTPNKRTPAKEYETVPGTPFLLKPIPKAKKKINTGPPTMNPIMDIVSPNGVPLRQMYLGKSVAFSPNDEDWMDTNKIYRGVGATYLVAVVKRFIPKPKQANTSKPNETEIEPSDAVNTGKKKKKNPKSQKCDMYELCWVDSKFQGRTVFVPFEKLLQGREHYAKLMRDERRQPSLLAWSELSAPDSSEEQLPPDDLADYEVEYEKFYERALPPTTVREVEAIENFHFNQDGNMEAPSDLFTHPDGSTMTRVKEEYKYIYS